MKRRADICVCVKLIETGNKSRQRIIPQEFRRSQLLAGRKQQINQCGNGKSKNDVVHQAPERGDIIEQSIQMHSHHVDKPEQVWNQKNLMERDQVVHKAVHGVIALNRIESLHEQKQNAKYRPE